MNQRSLAPLIAVAVFFALGSPPIRLAAQRSPAALAEGAPARAATAIVFDGVTVIDVQHGYRRAAQRVVIVGNRIHAMGTAGAVHIPTGAQVVDARGKYLIPGLWDMHTHPQDATDVFYPLFIANGVTGIRDATSPVPLDTLRWWRRDILAGTRIGPPRQILVGTGINDLAGELAEGDDSTECRQENAEAARHKYQHLCAWTPADARHLVDSLQAAGADMIKTYIMSPAGYFALAAEARRRGIPFGGHVQFPEPAVAGSAIAASDSGASIEDHTSDAGDLWPRCFNTKANMAYPSVASVAQCQPVADHFRRNGTWWVPTLAMDASINGKIPAGAFDPTAVSFGPTAQRVIARLMQVTRAFWDGTKLPAPWLPDSIGGGSATAPPAGFLRLVRQVGLPIAAGTDVAPDTANSLQIAGFSLHAELALYVAEGLTPLEALQTATLNPAKLLHATDSLGTVAPGKLADLVLLDADPLVNITNTTAIRAVVANGRYFDRAALDQLVTNAQATARTLHFQH